MKIVISCRPNCHKIWFAFVCVTNISVHSTLMPFLLYCLQATRDKPCVLMCVFARLRVCSCVCGGVRICHSNQAVRVIWSILTGRHTVSPPARGRALIPFIHFTTPTPWQGTSTPLSEWTGPVPGISVVSGLYHWGCCCGGVYCGSLCNSAWHLHHGVVGSMAFDWISGWMWSWLSFREIKCGYLTDAVK